MGVPTSLKTTLRGQAKKAWMLAHAFPVRVACNVCGWQGSRFFSDAWHPHSVCPRCRAEVRHRLLAAALTTLAGLNVPRLVTGKRVLHFAPEPAIARLFTTAGRYVTADFVQPSADLRLDMCDMRTVADGSFDLVVACDVLEHVRDDAAALREVRRVLSPGGYAILTVPQKDGLASKEEDPTVATPAARLKAYGQEDHVRIYGADFDRFVASHGFHVTAVDAGRFDASMVAKHVLVPPVLSPHPLATNHRKIFFATKGEP